MRRFSILLCGLVMLAAQASAQDPSAKPDPEYGAFIDAGYLLDFNHPENRLFRSRGTAWHVDYPYLNMAAAYFRKKPTDASRWGVELTAQAGKDVEIFGFSATAPNLGGYRFLRHLGPTNVSYLVPAGKGLTVQGGIFSSLIGYDSLYGKDNLSYTRPWGADFTPYLMLGVDASYPLNERVTVTAFAVNGYWHLANANSRASFGGQLAYKPTSHTTVKQTMLFGPHQENTATEFWRVLSDSIVEWKRDRATVAFEYQYSSEKVDTFGRPRALWMSAQMPLHYNLRGPWSVTVRPEVAWDRDGRWTLARQTVKAVTSTLEYRLPYRKTSTILRLEHRWDDSRGPDGGFFRGAGGRLVPSQHLLILGLIAAFESPVRP